MTAEIIAVGTELLLGDILNTNAQFLSKRLSELGINVFFQTVVGDNPDRLKSVIQLALSRSDVIITSGGLGPTHDDLTKETIAEVMGLELFLNQPSLDNMSNFFLKMNREMPASNIKQAMVPVDCIVLENTCGTAPGGIIEKDGKTVIFLPGPPREITTMFKVSVYPYLLSKSDSILFSKTLRIFGIGESGVEERLSSYMKTATNPTVAPYAKEGEVHLRITAGCGSIEQGKEMIAPVEAHIRSVLGEVVYGADEDTLIGVSCALLKRNGLKIAFAESCTGGMLASMVTDLPGASEILNESIITYSNEAKVKYLGVQQQTLDTDGAVSEATALEMAEGIRKASGADIGIGVTGIAGPDGGSEDKPVGLVYVGLSDGEETYVTKLLMAGNRKRVRDLACMNVFGILRSYLIKKYGSQA